MYWELSRLRQSKNHVEHYEPTGDEVFGDELPRMDSRGAS
jgi:hypothetical protein